MNASVTLSDALQKVAAEAVRRSQSNVSSHQRRTLPLKVGTRASPLALVQTRHFLTRLTRFCPVLRDMGAFQEHQISTEGDRNLVQRLADIGGKGLFAKEIHEALLAGRIDFAVHSLKDLETKLPDGLVLACTMKREDARDVIILRNREVEILENDPLACLPEGAVVGCASVRRQAQMLSRRPDLRFVLLRGNVQTRLDKLQAGACDATLLALAGLRRLGMEDRADIILEPDQMIPASGQGIVGVTVRESDIELRELLSAIEDPHARAVSTAERALLAELDGSCRTPIGGYARIEGDQLKLTGMVASEDGTFLLRREIQGSPKEAGRIGLELGKELRAETPDAIFAEITSV
ncbi:hydroxymethylbilane synthase [Swingsia samuiensis]|uniref:Porphobilinogen deaminase n=1 Tax=Swingsia samuiensis TaxID=1293412 RepID=A0A4Y6UMF4_9PROT|nr:hydroxymethylbilane synthase [Swingsia samuiensis]QDH17576.1 hydroxymethylbilane synthase [Swingsia samuiensis]